MRDPELFLFKYAPITTHLVFIEMDAQELTEKLRKRNQEICQMWEFPWTVGVDKVQGTSLEDKLKALLPLSSGYRDFLISQTKSGWSTYISNNFERGTDVHSQPGYYARTWKVKVLSLIMTQDIRGGQPGSTQFVLRDENNVCEEQRIRYVLAHKESRWEFEEYGQRLPFEDVEQYSAKRIKDRLTPAMLERYCAHLGIDLFNPDFYEGDAWVVKGYPLPQWVTMDHYPNQ